MIGILKILTCPYRGADRLTHAPEVPAAAKDVT